jgi:hemolysin III
MPPDAIHPFVFRHPVCAVTHLLFAAWALYAAALMRRLTCDPARRTAVTAFGVSLVLLYASSGVYHAAPADRPRLVEFFRLLDLGLIHLLIAGTATAALVLLPAPTRRHMLALVWLVAAAGVLSKWLLPLPAYQLTVALYAAAAALALLPLRAIGRAVGWRGLAWLLGGAFAYGVGGACEAARGPVLWPGVVGPHEVLHLCDMVGSTTHVLFVLRFVTPSVPSSATPPPRSTPGRCSRAPGTAVRRRRSR